MAGPRFELLDPDEVEYGRVDQVSPTIRRVIAENPSKFSYLGTGTYIVGRGDVVVIDPGPALDSHRDALGVALAGERVRAILVTHCHADHSPLAAWMAAETGAPTVAIGPHPRPSPDDDPDDDEPDDLGTDADGNPINVEDAVDFDFAPDLAVADGEVAFDGPGMRFTAVHTPGHTSNHACYAYESAAEGHSVLFSGDHVMGWSTTVVSPPDGDMAAYIDSLRKVAGRDDAVFWPTHGPSRDDGAEHVRALVEHRIERERQVLAAVRSGLASIAGIVAVLYVDVREELHKAAGRSVLAHMSKLVAEGQVVVVDGDRPRLRSTYAAT